MKSELFIEMLNDKYSLNYEKLKYKYGNENLTEYIRTISKGLLTFLPIKDSNEKQLCYMPSKIQMTMQKLKVFMQKETRGINFLEDEILSTLSIEDIYSTRESVREILKGYAPKTDDEKKAYGIKLGLDFISDTSNVINEENLHKLYMLACGDYVEDNNKLIPKNKYRHDKVYIVGNQINADVLHEGVDYNLIPKRINELLEFINNDNVVDDITKSIIAHYYLAYLHPYFDGNGRTARLLQMWVLIQKGYPASLYLPFSKFINNKKTNYYKSFETVAQNTMLSGMTDITPFIRFFVDNVINQLEGEFGNTSITEEFELLIKNGEITQKECELFYFVLSTYGANDFSTKDLEKDFRDVAYATVRSFCLKLEEKKILSSVKLGNRVRYKLNFIENKK